jgi:hypothetical protein
MNCRVLMVEVLDAQMRLIERDHFVKGSEYRKTPIAQMKTKCLIFAGCAALAGLLTGCQTVPPGVERGPHGTVAYDILVEASEPGARIESNGEYVGNTPVHLKVFGDRDGTFHDFGNYDYVIQASPLATNQFAQVRAYGTGRGWTHADPIPQRVYFDMNQKPPPQPPAVAGGPRYYPYPYPYYYGPYPYYYGPYWWGPRIVIGPGWRWRHW